jgi:ATP-dependent Clp protease ATP-binding subunit ClpA
MAINSNPEIEEIIASATELARDYRHEYVTLEHLLIALVEFRSFKKLLTDYGIDTTPLLADLYEYTAQQDHLVDLSDKEIVPQRTHSLERVFNRAFTQVLFTAREQMEPVDLFLSISQETNSHAAYFMLKWGINRKDLIKYYSEKFVDGKAVKTKDPKVKQIVDKFIQAVGRQSIQTLTKKQSNKLLDAIHARERGVTKSWDPNNIGNINPNDYGSLGS